MKPIESVRGHCMGSIARKAHKTALVCEFEARMKPMTSASSSSTPKPTIETVSSPSRSLRHASAKSRSISRRWAASSTSTLVRFRISKYWRASSDSALISPVNTVVSCFSCAVPVCAVQASQLASNLDENAGFFPAVPLQLFQSRSQVHPLQGEPTLYRRSGRGAKWMTKRGSTAVCFLARCTEGQESSSEL